MPQQTERQIRKSEQKQKLLVDAARKLFSSQGYAGTTIDDIVNEADVAKVTFYAYFKSKEEIALRIRTLCFEEVLAYTDTLLSKNLTPSQMMDAVITDVAEWTEQNWRLLDVFCAQRFSPLLERSSVTECKPEPMVICLSAIIRKGQEAGEYRKDIDDMKVAHLLDLAILCEQYYWMQSGRPGSQALIVKLKECFDFALHGILDRTSIASSTKN